MMDNEILQSLIGHFVELKDKINSLKTDISAVTAGQEKLKTELKTDVSAVTAGQEELKTDINAVTAGQKELKTELKTNKSAVTAGQEEFENSISAVKCGISALETKINACQEKLRQEISAFQERIEAGQAEFEKRVTRNIEATRQDFETRLAALEARRRRVVGSSAGVNADKVKPPKFDGSTSWVVFHCQFDAAATHNDWTPREKAAHLLSVL
jgi:chromosome segregation ATPase